MLCKEATHLELFPPICYREISRHAVIAPLNRNPDLRHDLVEFSGELWEVSTYITTNGLNCRPRVSEMSYPCTWK